MRETTERDRILAERIAAAAPAIARSTTDAMYRDPFWDARFGSRGRARAVEDAAFHLQYLVTSLRADDPNIFVEYAHWLRDLLVPRGMCSLHVARHFEEVGHALQSALGEDAGPAVAILDRGTRALQYPSGPANALDVARSEIAHGAARRLESASLPPPPGADMLQHLSYLTDTVHSRLVGSFVSYRGFLVDHPELLAARSLTPCLAALGLEIRDRLGPEVADRADDVLRIDRTEVGRHAT